MTRLLIAYDGSQSAAAAIELAAGLFPGAEAVIAHVAAVMAVGGDADTGARAEATADEGVSLATDAGLRATAAPVATAGGSAVSEVMELADEHDVELIVVCTDGRSRLHSALTGSGTTGIVNRSTRPVLVAPCAR